MKKILSTILASGIFFANITAVQTVSNAESIENKLNIYEPVIDYDEGTVTVGGYVDDFIYNKYDPLSINLIVTEADTSYSELKQSLTGLVYMYEIPVSEDGSFEWTYSDSLAQDENAAERSIYFTDPFSGEKDTAYYVMADGDSFDEVLNVPLLLSAQSPVYYINGQLKESMTAPYIDNNEIYIPKTMLDDAEISYSGTSEYIAASSIAKDKYISVTTGLVVVGKSDCESFDNTIANTMFGVYVSPNGNDNNSGSAMSPVKSVLKAVELSEKASVMHKTVYIHGGEYIFDDTISLDAANKNLTIKAFCNENVKITRDTFIPADKFDIVSNFDGLSFPESVHGKLMVTDLSHMELDDIAECQEAESYLYYTPEVKRYYQVYQNDVFQTLARFPNGEKTAYYADQDGGYYDNTEKLKLWENTKNAYLYSYKGDGYSISRNLITGTDVENGKINFDFTGTTPAHKNKGFFVYNIPEELDAAGEWYIDNNKLYYYPLKGFTGIDFVSCEKPFVRINNTSGISIKGIEFEYTRSSAIIAENVNNILLEGITIHGVTGVGIHMDEAAKITVKDSELYDIGMRGVDISQDRNSDGETDLNYPADYLITNNHIYNWSTYKSMQMPGINVSCVGAEISYNTVHASNHTAIQLAGCDINVHHNDIYAAVREAGDAGGIYCGGKYNQRGIKIDSNFLHDMYDYVFPFYCDDIISGVEVTNNIIKDNRYTGQFSAGRDNTFSGNKIINSGFLNYETNAANGGWRSPTKTAIEITILDKIENGTIDEAAWREKYRGFGEFLDEIKNSTENDFHELSFDGGVTYNTYYKTLGLPKNFIYKDNEFVKTDDYERRENWFDTALQKNVDAKHLASGTSGVLEEHAAEMQSETLLSSMPQYSLDGIGSTLESRTEPVQPVYPQNGETNVDSEFTMVWNNAHGITRYKVKIAKDSEFNDCVLDTTVYNNYLDLGSDTEVDLDLDGEIDEEFRISLEDGTYYAKIIAVDERLQCLEETETSIVFTVGEENFERTVIDNNNGTVTVTITSSQPGRIVDVFAAGKTSLGVLQDIKYYPSVSIGTEWSETITVDGDIKEVYIWEPDSLIPVFDKWSNKK